jgi:hypothetical protein
VTQTEQATPAQPQPRPAGDGGWQGFTTAVSGSRVTLCALVIVAAQVCLNTFVLNKGFFQQDDFAIAGLAAHSLSWHLLLQNYGGHLMPGVFLFAWLPTHAGGYDWGLWAGTLIILQAFASLAVLRALRTLVGNRMLLLIPLAVFAFTPMTLADLAWWSVGIQSVPIQIAVALAVDQHVRYVRSGRVRNAVCAFVWVVFGLAFFEKAAGIPLLLFALTIAYLVPGSWGQAIRSTLRKHWIAWTMYVVAIIGEIVIYVSGLNSSSVQVPLASNAFTFSWHLIWDTFVPAALGGPWHWAGVSATPASWLLYLYSDTPTALLDASWVIAGCVVIASLWYRARAWRAWVILLGWLLVVDAGPVILGRLAAFGTELSSETGYVTDAAPVLAICLTIAFLPLRDEERPYRAVRPRALPKALTLGTVSVLLLASCAWSAVAYRDKLRPQNTRSYIATASAALKSVPPDSVIYPSQLPNVMVWQLFGPLSQVQNALRPLVNQVVGQHFQWSGAPTGKVTNYLIFNASGQLVPATVTGAHSLPFAKPSDCVLHTKGMRLSLTANVFALPLVMQIGYFAAKQVTLAVSFGGRQYRLTLPASGLAYGYLPVQGPGSTVVITPVTPSPSICIGTVSVGTVGPSAKGAPVPLFPAAG